MRIRNLGLIADATASFGSGFTVLTGETGAGKTMLITGLSLLSGHRAEKSRVRAGTKQASAEGFFSVQQIPEKHFLRDFLDEEDLEPTSEKTSTASADFPEGIEVIVERTVAASGRSRARIHGSAVPISKLATLGSELIAIHGQAEQWRLRDSRAHREMLDGYGGQEIAIPAQKYQQLFAQYSELLVQQEKLQDNLVSRAQMIEMLRLGIERISEITPVIGEQDTLQNEINLLSNAEIVAAGLNSAAWALSGGAEGHSENAVDLLALARDALERLPHTASIAQLRERLSSAWTELNDISGELEDVARSAVANPHRLAELQQRKADLVELCRLYGPEISDVLDWQEKAIPELFTLEHADDRLAEIGAQIDKIKPKLAQAALSLRKARQQAAESFAKAVQKELHSLSMPDARLQVSVEPETRGGTHPTAVSGEKFCFSAHGTDSVLVQLQSHENAPFLPVASSASGGELSRIMLAIELVSAGDSDCTFLFDEVDAGVGGSAGAAIGARLAALAANNQVIVVTHLPQVAAYASDHLVIEKTTENTRVRTVTGEERVQEIARMLAGDSASTTAHKHARELINASTTPVLA